MKKIAVVYTSMGGLVSTLKKTLSDITESEIVNIADDSLIHDVIINGTITDSVRNRMNHYFHAAADTGADLIISACSSVGDLAEEASKFLPIPLLRIDHAMIKKAIETGNRIGVLASLNTTLNPTVRYVYSIAEEMNKQVEVISCVADGAYEANNNGNSELHDKLLEQSAIGMVDKVDVLILAQGSMAKMEQRLHEITGIPVYSSPKLCALEAKELLEEL